jgi:hypothetical protein
MILPLSRVNHVGAVGFPREVNQVVAVRYPQEVNQAKGVVLRCGKCDRVLGEAVAGFVWNVRHDFAGRYTHAPGPMRRDVEYSPGMDGKPHRLTCRSKKCRKPGNPGGSVWYLRQLPSGPSGTEVVLS